jgi:hypothetical protein
MKTRMLFLAGTLSIALFGDTLGYFEQKFNSINFEKGKWDRSEKQGCYAYSAREDGAQVEVMRYSTANLVPFRAKRALTVTVCADVAVFDEGFEASARPIVTSTSR